MQHLDRDTLFTAWADAETLPVLCVTRRLADDLVHAYARYRSARGDTAWPAPDCLGWRAWLVDRFEALAQRDAIAGTVPPRLLSDGEALALWYRIVSDASATHPLLQVPRMAQLAADAWQSAHDYCVALPVGLPEDEDASAFDAWAATFHHRLQELTAITVAEVPAVLESALREGRLAAPKRLAVGALDRPTPAQARLLEALAEAGTSLIRLEAPSWSQPTLDYLPCNDRATEYATVAGAVRDAARARPEARIGVVVPDLALQRDAIQRSFDAVLCPWLSPGDDPARRPYRISQGEALAEQPVIRAALDWLSWGASARGAALNTASRALHTPFWQGGSETGVIAQLDRALRLARLDPVPLEQAARALPGATPTLAEALRAAALPRDRTLPSQWAQRFATALEALGWPGTLDSTAFQAHRAWNESLSAFGRLDSITGSLSSTAALRRLREQLHQQIFQPQSGGSHIQLLGVLEAAGLAFDTLFIVGLDESQWPPEARPIPLLPEALQRRAGIPQATAEGQLDRARAITDDLLTAAPEITLSWPTQVDEQTARLSALLPAPAHDPGAPQASEPPPAWRALFSARAAEDWRDERAHAAPGDRPLAGGVQRLGEYAECPFRALAHYGLGAEAPSEPEAAPDPMERGQLAHDIMASLWRSLRDSDGLRALQPDAEARQVAEAVDHHLQAWRQRAPHRATEGVVTVERARLQRHVRALLAIDRSRTDFAVEWLEGALMDQRGAIDHTIDLHGLTVRVRPDRIDHIPGVGRIVIDYKTGRTGTPVAHTLTAPQLAVYAGLLEDCVGVAYAPLRAGGTGYVGIIDNDAAEAMPMLTPVRKLRGAKALLDDDDWAAVQRLWDAQLGAVAAGLRAGDARVDPLPGVCARCDLQPFCRIHTLNAFAGDDEEIA